MFLISGWHQHHFRAFSGPSARGRSCWSTGTVQQPGTIRCMRFEQLYPEHGLKKPKIDLVVFYNKDTCPSRYMKYFDSSSGAKMCSSRTSSWGMVNKSGTLSGSDSPNLSPSNLMRFLEMSTQPGSLPLSSPGIRLRHRTEDILLQFLWKADPCVLDKNSIFCSLTAYSQPRSSLFRWTWSHGGSVGHELCNRPGSGKITSPVSGDSWSWYPVLFWDFLYWLNTTSSSCRRRSILQRWLADSYLTGSCGKFDQVMIILRLNAWFLIVLHIMPLVVAVRYSAILKPMIDSWSADLVEMFARGCFSVSRSSALSLSWSGLLSLSAGKCPLPIQWPFLLQLHRLPGKSG